MKNTLEKLDQYICEKRPDFYQELNPGLSETEIKALEEKYKRQIPGDLKLLYQWKNGQSEEAYDSFMNNSTFTPLETALEEAQEFTGMIGFDFDVENWWNEHWIPVFTNGGGDHICYDAGGIFTGKAGQLVEFWHADNDRNVIAPDLESFLNELNNYYEATGKEDFDGYFEVNEVDGYPQRFMVG